jgi:hypothetical protein
MRKIISKQVDFARRNAIIIVRINLRGVNSPVLTDLSPDPREDALSEADVIRLRQELDDVYGAAQGTQAWNELVGHIDQLYALDEFEKGNSDSPLGKPIDQTSSIEPSGDIASNGGLSTTSNIEPLPADGSETTTGRSSDSISATEAPTVTSSPTVEA